MATEKDEPAFPYTESLMTSWDTGMSLRDYFAAAALAGICGDAIPGSHHLPENTAHDAYVYADAMLKERAK